MQHTHTPSHPHYIHFCSPPVILSSAAVGLNRAVQRGKSALYSAGLSEDAHMYFGGHSLGGAMMPGYVQEHESADTAQGMALMGAFLPREYKTGVTAPGRPQVGVWVWRFPHIVGYACGVGVVWGVAVVVCVMVWLDPPPPPLLAPPLK